MYSYMHVVVIGTSGREREGEREREREREISSEMASVWGGNTMDYKQFNRTYVTIIRIFIGQYAFDPIMSLRGPVPER